MKPLYSFTIIGPDCFYEIYITGSTIHRVVRTPFDSDRPTEVRFDDLDVAVQDKITDYMHGDYV